MISLKRSLLASRDSLKRFMPLILKLFLIEIPGKGKKRNSDTYIKGRRTIQPNPR